MSHKRRAARGLLAAALAALLVSVAALLAFGAGASSAATPTYTITDLGSFSAKSMNDLGQVVGTSSWRAVLYEAGQPLKDLGTLPGDSSSEAYDVNNAGQVVGTSGGGDRAFFYESGQMTELSPPSGYFWPWARAINNAGQVVGSFSDNEFTLHAFLYQNGQMKKLYQGDAHDINDAGQVVGEMVGAHASLYDFGRLKDLGTLPNQEISRGMAINDAGQVVGYAFNEPDGSPRAFLYENGQIKDLTGLAVSRPSGFTLYEAYGINDSGTVVGYGSYGSNANEHAFVYENGRAQDLNDVVPFLSGRLLMKAHTITDDGEILVTGTEGGVGHAYLLKPDASQGDTKAPTVSIDAPPKGAVFKEGQTITASYSCDDGEGGSGIQSCVGPVQTGSAIDTSTAGQKRFTVTATDSAGNKKVVSHNYAVQSDAPPDTTAPSGTVSINNGAAFTLSPSVNLKLSATDPAPGTGVSKMRFSNDGVNWTAWQTYATNKAWTFTSTNGTKTIRVQYKDNAGNPSAVAKDTIVLDTAAPSAPVIKRPANNSYDTNGIIAFSGTAEANSTVKISEGTALKATVRASSTGNWSARLDGVAEGRHTYSAKAKDAAGRVSAASNAVTVVVDKTKPKAGPLAYHNLTNTDFWTSLSEPMRASTINENTFTLRVWTNGRWSELAANVTYNAARTKAELDPVRDLRCGKSYEVRLSTGARDLAGNPMVKNYAWPPRIGGCIVPD